MIFDTSVQYSHLLTWKYMTDEQNMEKSIKKGKYVNETMIFDTSVQYSRLLTWK